MGAVFVAIQQRGETDPLAGEWSGPVVLIFQFWGASLADSSSELGPCSSEGAPFAPASASSSAASPALNQPAARFP